jgi:tetratricopeptide (TPR) repeat protein
VKPEDWARVKELFEEALRLPPAERSALVAARTDDPEVAAEVRSLLSVYEQSPEFLEEAAFRAPAAEPDALLPSGLEGQRVGAWRLIREIGRGGMGVVWEAQRADEEYQQRVAVKLLPFGPLSAAAVGRFREERQILAGLTHPGIARLLDGGTAENGAPYLVMEYVEGQPLDEWSRSRNLPLRARLELFLSVCEAVEYAHRHLVIHRDLKPDNILVTREGAPKLLDFGIAKLLGDGAAPRPGSTPTGGRLLTPEYASPEQIRGEGATTASDVYSLGVVLYALLTGRRPYATDAQNPLAMLRAVCEQEPPAPSAVAESGGKELRGELDAIIFQALRKDPEQRYHSVRALADDLRAWLDGKPVSAHLPRWWGRAAKLVRRNKVPSAAVGLAVLSLLGGSAVSLWQARVAEREKGRAESRFRQVRRFSRSVLFELDEAIRNLPGATPARNLLLARATEFLDDLARDSGNDVSLKLELAEGYRRLGHVQGSTFSDNLGLRDSAIQSFRKAAALGEQALVAAPKNLDAEILLLGAYDDLTGVHLAKSEVREADAWYAKHRNLLSIMETEHLGDNRARDSVASSYSALGYYRAQRNDLVGAKECYRKAVDIYAALLKSGYDSAQLRIQYPFALKRLGAILISENSLGPAEGCYWSALSMEDRSLAADPGNTRLRIDRTFTLSDLAFILKKKSDFGHAAQVYEEVVRTRKAALEADPGNMRFLSLTASAELNLGAVYSSQKRHREAIPLSSDAVRLRDRAFATTKAAKELREAAVARVSLAFHYLNAAEDAPPSPARRRWASEAAALLQQVRPVLEEIRRGQNLSRSDQALVADFKTVQERLRKLGVAVR